MIDERDRALLRRACQEARVGLAEGGFPIGAVLARRHAGNDEVVALGRNRTVLTGDQTAHAELDCLRNAGPRVKEDGLTLYVTMSPCGMCRGAILHLGIPRVVIGDPLYFPGDPDALRAAGVTVEIANDAECAGLADHFHTAGA